MIDSKDEKEIERFFQLLAHEMNSAVPESLLPFYHVPSVFVSNDEKSVCSSEEQVFSRLTQLLVSENDDHLLQHEPTIVHMMSLSDAILFAKVEWQISSVDSQESTYCSTSYTLERGGEHGFDIIVSVIGEEEKALNDLHAKLEHE